jgi:hypothetical protein
MAFYFPHYVSEDNIYSQLNQKTEDVNDSVYLIIRTQKECDNGSWPIATNKPLKQKLVGASLFVIYSVLLTEYILNPHSLFNTKEEGGTVFLPPCLIVEPYIGYNIFLFGLPLAIFLHVKLSVYQYHKQFGFLVFLEFILATIILSYDQIRGIHSGVSYLIIITTAMLMFDMDSKGFWIRVYCIVFLCAFILVLVGHLYEQKDKLISDNFIGIMYLVAFVLWVGSQWPLCTEFQEKPRGYDSCFSAIVSVTALSLIIVSNVYPEWGFIAKNKVKPWEIKS